MHHISVGCAVLTLVGACGGDIPDASRAKGGGGGRGRGIMVVLPGVRVR